MAPMACVGSASPIEVNVAPPSVVIQTPPPAAPTNILPGVVGSAAIAVTRPVASNALPGIVPPKFGTAPFIGSGPMNAQVGLTASGVVAVALADGPRASSLRMCSTAARYAPG